MRPLSLKWLRSTHFPGGVIMWHLVPHSNPQGKVTVTAHGDSTMATVIGYHNTPQHVSIPCNTVLSATITPQLYEPL